MQQLFKQWWFPSLVVLLSLGYFAPGWHDVWRTLSSPIFWENGLAFVILAVVIAGRAVLGKELTHHLSRRQGLWVATGLGGVVLADLINLVWFQFSIVPAILAIAGLAMAVGVALKARFWPNVIWLFGLLAMCLPVLERLQRFIGFPFRMLSAQVVSWLLDFLGVAHVSQSTVIVTENAAASIDIPCSGVTSLYTGTLFLLAIWYLERPKLSWRSGLAVLAFYVALVGFNIWRVFSLTYIYGVLGLTAAGDTIHVGLGVVGFVISCWLGWWMLRPARQQTVAQEVKTRPAKITTRTRAIVVGTLLSLLVFKGAWILTHPEVVVSAPTEARPSVGLNTTLTLTPQPISGIEAAYFQSQEVAFSQKWQGQLPNGKVFSVLVVGSRSARTHHDPETCQQGLGHQLDDSQIIQTGNILVRELTLNGNQDALYYWYASKDEHILDYSQRVWAEVQNPQELWVLTQVGFAQRDSFTDAEISGILHELYQNIDELIKNQAEG